MDEGNRLMKSQGWQNKVFAFFAGAAVFFHLSCGFASPIGVRDIRLEGSGKVKIQLDGILPGGNLSVEYVRDIVQFSLQNATIYPARILHSPEEDRSAFSKLFAYQYAPNLVRVRFSVGTRAELYLGKIRYEVKGKELLISFPEKSEGATEEPESSKVSSKGAEKSDNVKERSLLSKVLSQTSEQGPDQQANDSSGERAHEKLEQTRESKGRVKLGGKAPVTAELGGKSKGPSVFRTLMAMFLVVGGLGLVLVFLKKKGASQAKRVGDSWFSSILPGNRKQKAFIEVIASHALGPKQSITIVRIKEQQFVLGVTQDSVQLITQLDADETDLDLLEDPKVADSIGKMFGSKVRSTPQNEPVVQPRKEVQQNFDTILKSSTGAGAVVARNAYRSQLAPIERAVGGVSPGVASGAGVRDQIRRRLQQGVGNV